MGGTPKKPPAASGKEGDYTTSRANGPGGKAKVAYWYHNGNDWVKTTKTNYEAKTQINSSEFESASRIGIFDKPDQNYASSVGTPKERTLLKYPSGQAINENSDYVLFQFKKYNPPFGDRTDVETYKRWGGWGAKYSWFSGDLAALNFDNEKLTKYLNKANDYNQANDYKPAGPDYPSIIMYMPEDVSTGFRGNWGGKAFSTVGAGILGAAGQAGLANKFTSGFGTLTSAAERSLGLAAAKVLQKTVKAAGGDQLTKDDIFGSISGAIMNPNTELMFQSVDMRNFMLKFKLVPRNVNESQEINRIISIFKACTLPLRNPGQVMGFNNPDKAVNKGIVAGFIGVPNLCRVCFMRGANEHMVLPRYKMLAVTQVDVNYTPDGAYATYRDDGQPVAIELSINFQETKINFAEEAISGSIR